jgi:hypothetical protein
MAVNDKTDMVVQGYSRNQFPVLEEGLRRYFQDELQRIEIAITSLIQAATQVTETEPEAPVKGMIRFAVSPWDPLGTGFEGLVVYDGTSWAAV